MIPNLGPCGICSKPIHEFTPTDSVLLGYPPKGYLVHKDCKRRSLVDPRDFVDEQEPVDDEPPGVITHVLPDPPDGQPSARRRALDELTRDGEDEMRALLDASQQPAMPFVEQQVRKRGRPRKETS